MKETDLITTTIFRLVKENGLTEEELFQQTRVVIGKEYSHIVSKETYQEARDDLGPIIGRDEMKRLYLL